ncbi:MAG: LysR family transcriptional regulator [Hyphomicrobiales bacterium]|nr:LysR family transcriptional regulator [Hyphomicrobiales bacterium]
MDRFLELETFVAVVESGSLSGAARRLNIAVSAVSRRMDELETRLGVRLATRSTRGFALTALGETYYERSLRLLGDFAEANASVRDEQSELKGLLRVAAPMSFGLKHIAPVAARLMTEAPDLRVELDLSDRRIDLIGEGVDLAVRIGSLEDSSLIARKLFDVQHVVAASPDFWDRHGRPVSPDALRDYPALGYRTGAGALPWSYRTVDGQRRTVSVTPKFLTNNGDALVMAAKHGLGVLLEPQFICEEGLASGALEEVLGDYSWIGVSAYIVYPSGRALPARARHMIDLLVSELGG